MLKPYFQIDCFLPHYHLSCILKYMLKTQSTKLVFIARESLNFAVYCAISCYFHVSISREKKWINSSQFMFALKSKRSRHALSQFLYTRPHCSNYSTMTATRTRMRMLMQRRIRRRKTTTITTQQKWNWKMTLDTSHNKNHRLLVKCVGIWYLIHRLK